MKYLKLFENFIPKLRYEFKCTDCDRNGFFYDTIFGDIDSTEFAQIIDRIEENPIDIKNLEYNVEYPSDILDRDIEVFKLNNIVVIYDIDKDIHYIYTIPRLNESKNEDYDNWIRYTDESLKSDWSEYKKKESTKWKQRSHMMDFRFPIFKDINEFKTMLDQSPIIELTHSIISNVRHATDMNNLEDLKDMVSQYVRPRDINRIIEGFESNDRLPMPIILESKLGMFIMAGNTRQNVARIMGITPKAILINLDKI